MKKLYIPLFLSLFLILSLLCGCFCLSHCAQHQVAELKKCTDTLPSAEEFDRIRKNPERTALLEEQLKYIESKTKRAEEKLALFINYNYLNTLSTAASALRASSCSAERADYQMALETYKCALSTIEHLETLSLELFL